MRGIFADPVFIVLVILTIGVLIGCSKRVLGRSVVLLGILVLYLLATPFVAERLYQLVQTDWTSESARGDAGAIVVLPAGTIPRAPEYAGDTIDGLTLQRVRFAARLQRTTGLPIMVTGGTAKHASISAAEAMRGVLFDEFDVPVAWIEKTSLNTQQHAENCAPILHKQDIRSVLLVTHAAHMPRARAAFERAGLAVIPAPTVFATTYLPFSVRQLLPRSQALLKSWYALHEFIGGIWYQFSYGSY